MNAVTSWLRARRTTASVVVIGLVVGTPITLAVLHPGFPVTDVELTARDVWVTNGATFQAGRLNRQINELNGQVTVPAASFDVLQDGDDVFVIDKSTNALDRVNASYTSFEQHTPLPDAAGVVYGGGLLAVLEGATGRVWTTDATSDLRFDYAAAEPLLTLGRDAQIVLTPAGTLIAASPDDDTLTRVTASGSVSEQPFDAPDDFALTAVGEHAVLLDFEHNSVEVDGGEPIDLPVEAVRLQQAGPDSAYALVASGTSLLRVALDGSEVLEVDAEVGKSFGAAEVSAPVYVDGCAHAAWSGAARYLFACDNGDEGVRDILGATAGTLEFRVNRDVVVLNNLTTGDVFLLDEDMTLVDNWKDVTPPEESPDESDGESKATLLTFEQILADRPPDNRPPTAVNDSFGARPGSATLLPVLANDSDEDGDVLTIKELSGFDDSRGALQLVDHGRSLQFTSKAGEVGTVSFRYTVTDGRTGGTAEASVDVLIRQPSEHAPPEQFRDTTIFVEAGQSISYNVLGDWNDPDGDSLVLDSATPTTADVVRVTPSGLLTFQSTSTELGAKEVNYVVSDDQDEATGTITVDVQPIGSLPPIATPDYVTTVLNERVVIDPLANDLTPSGIPLTLIGATPLTEGPTVTANPDLATIDFLSSQVGTYYLTYELGAGAKTGLGLVRVDVVEPPENSLPPIAVRDTAYLRGSEPTTIGVLSNDISPSGRVLAVQSIDVPASSSALTVELLGNALVRISSATPLAEALTFTYTIADGEGDNSSTTTVTVVPLPVLVKNQAPVAVDDTAKVRAGDIVSVSVLDNDSHPDAVDFSLEPELLDAPEQGVAFATGDQVRFQAPDTEGNFSVGYGIVDANGERATARVTFTVLPLDDENNAAPLPVPLTARVFSGAQVAVNVPLDGIDPNGDSVILTDVSDGALGARLAVGSSSFVYEAYADSSGTDTLVYEVVDAFGESAIGTVKIAVIPRGAESMRPTATDDSAAVRPSRTSTIAVLDNDSDPNGYEIKIDPDSLTVPEGIEAAIVNNRIEVTTGPEEGAFTLGYVLTNGTGGEDAASVFISVDENAPLQYPVAADHSIERADLAGSDTYDLDVRVDAENPSGRVSDLAISLAGPNAGAAEVLDNGLVRVTPSDKRMAIAYRLTNETDELSAMAFIIVPAKPGANFDDPPRFRDDLVQPVAIDRNETTSWTLEELLTVPSGRPAILSGADSVFNTRGNGQSSFLDETTLTFTPEKDYAGLATIRFEVTDGNSGADPDGNKAVLTLQIQVGDPNQLDVAPTFTPPNVVVEADGTLAVDLAASTAHVNPQVIAQTTYDHDRTVSGNTEVTASISGQTLTLAAPRTADIGSTAVVSFTLHYADFEVPGSVKVTVVSSTKPLAQAVEDHEYTERGTEISFDPRVNDTNPFPDEALEIIDATVVNGASGASVAFTASSVTVTTNPSFIGDVELRYQVADATKDDESRWVTGRSIVTVWDAPDRPAAPAIVSSGDQTITISFAPPGATNGSTVTGYVVRSNPASAAPTCTAGVPCQFTGLANGTAYTFYVTANGAVPGTTVTNSSEESAASAQRKPFGVPSQPTSANLSMSDNIAPGRGELSWGLSSNTGGGSARYYWRLYRDGGYYAGTYSTGGSYSQGSLEAATYYFEVQACNEGTNGDWSNCSAWVTSNSAQVIQQTEWSATATSPGWCPEDDFVPPGHFNASGPTCSGPSGFVNPGTALTLYCYANAPSGWTYSVWYRFTGGGYSNWLIPAEGTSGSTSGMPAC